MSCDRKTLASRPGLGGVEQCECGTVHLTIGAVTLRVTPGTVPMLAELLVEAATAILAVSHAAATEAEAWS